MEQPRFLGGGLRSIYLLHRMLNHLATSIETMTSRQKLSQWNVEGQQEEHGRNVQIVHCKYSI